MSRQTKRRYAHELYPQAGECEIRDLSVEVPALYARAQGLMVQGTGWHDLFMRGDDNDLREATARTVKMLLSAQLALAADALLQGLTGNEAWEWVQSRSGGDTIGEWVWERGTHYGVDLARIKPYRCGPELTHHDHMASTGDVMGDGLITRIDCPEDECPVCTEAVS